MGSLDHPYQVCRLCNSVGSTCRGKPEHCGKCGQPFEDKMHGEKERQLMKDGWVGFDLDGTLARYDGWQGAEHIGEPIEQMVQQAKVLIADGVNVRIFTARVSGEDRQGVPRERVIELIEDWCEQHLGVRLPVTCVKDFGMIALFDDRAIAVEPNTGRILGGTSMLERM